MSCPNGHTGAAFCCEDHVNQIMATFVERYEKWSREDKPLMLMTMSQYRAYQRAAKEQENGKGRLEEADRQGQV